VFLQYHRAQTEAGLRRALENWDTPLSSFLASPTYVDEYLLRFWPAWLREHPNAYLFPGYLTLVLAAAAWCLAKPPRPSADPRRWWRRAALALDTLVLAGLAGGVWSVWSGRAIVKVGELVLLTARRPWRIWLITFGAAALRLALARAVPMVWTRPREALETLAAWRRTNRRNALLLYTLLALVCLWLTMGPPLGLWQFVYWWPGMSLVRAHTRFSILGMLCLAVVAGEGFDRISARLSQRSTLALAVVVGALFVFEFALMPLGTRPYPVEIPAIDRWLDSASKPFTVAEVPMRNPDNVAFRERQNVYYMLHETAHWQKTVHGFSGIFPPKHIELYLAMANFPDDESLRRLAEMRVTYVVVHMENYDPEAWPALEAKLAAYRQWLTLEHTEGGGRVYSLHQP
jgi:hypothetical protein